MPRYNTEQDFWNKIDIKGKDDCWEWLASTTGSSGKYGQVYFQKIRYKAHRLAWIFTHGEIINDLKVLHKCHNKLCCNPNHLRLGTDEDNMRDDDITRFPQPVIDYIRQENSQSKLPNNKTARLLGISSGWMSQILNNKKRVSNE